MPKQLIVLCDGTGDSPEANLITNVQILREMLGVGLPGTRKKFAEPLQGWEVDQFELPNQTRLVYYDRGLGAPKLDKHGKLISWGWKPQSFFKNAKYVYDNFKTGHEQITADGIIDNVAEAYLFLAKNYEPGDQIFLFGFSRGAYTQRILITLIRYIGLLDKKFFTNDEQLKTAVEFGFRLYSMDQHPDQNVQVKKFRTMCHPYENLVHFAGLWDTVRGMVVEKVHQDAKLSSVVKTARHAISIDELREIFKPELWIAGPTTDSIQMWFAGVHSDIGGSYIEKGLSNIALHWMVEEANKFALQLDPQIMVNSNLTPDPLAMQHDSYNASVAGNISLKWTDLSAPYRRFLLQTAADECIHSSVIERFGKSVKNGEDNIVYIPPIFAHELTAYNNLKKITSFDEVIAKLTIPDADALADAGEVTSLIPKP
jgi:uncharacterized protein (DUF2235 family)